MTLRELQSEIYRELMEMEECDFKPGWTWFITRNACQDFEAKLFEHNYDTSYQWDNPYAGRTGFIRYTWSAERETLEAMKTNDDFCNLIYRIWDELPKECKKDEQ